MKDYINIYLAIALFMFVTLEVSIIESIGEVRPSYTVEWDFPIWGLVFVAFYVFGYMHRHTMKK